MFIHDSCSKKWPKTQTEFLFKRKSNFITVKITIVLQICRLYFISYMFYFIFCGTSLKKKLTKFIINLNYNTYKVASPFYCKGMCLVVVHQIIVLLSVDELFLPKLQPMDTINCPKNHFEVVACMWTPFLVSQIGKNSIFSTTLLHSTLWQTLPYN